MKRHRALDGASFCTNRCATLYRMEHGFETDYIATKRRRGYRTDIERAAESALVELGIRYEFEKKVGRYSVDFVLPDHGIALECDGWQHYTPQGRARDAVRDAYLVAAGWRVIHLEGQELRRKPLEMVSQALGVTA